ncbi:MAG: pyridoxamine 5'-phosphate oxidase family protein [Ferruginibacter sp.]
MANAADQPTHNLSGSEALKKLKEMAEKARTCMFTTNLQHIPGNTRPMSLQEVDENDGTLYFLSSTESEKNKDIAKDGRTALTFQNDGKSEYLAVYGNAEIYTDQATKTKYWTDFANAWFEGKDDPTLSVIGIKPDSAHYWDTKDGKILAYMKMSYAALTGADVDDGGVEGKMAL